MEIDSGAPYYKAEVITGPNRTVEGTVIVQVQYCNGGGKRIAHFNSDCDRAMKLKEGDTLYVCPCDGDAYIDEHKTRNKML